MAEHQQETADSSTKLREDLPPPYTEAHMADVTNDDPRAPLLSAEPQNRSRYTSQEIVITNQPHRVHGGCYLSPEDEAAISSERCTAICFSCCVYWCFCWLFGLIAFCMAMNIEGDVEERKRTLAKSRRVSLAGLIIGAIVLTSIFIFRGNIYNQ